MEKPKLEDSKYAWFDYADFLEVSLAEKEKEIEKWKLKLCDSEDETVKLHEKIERLKDLIRESNFVIWVRGEYLEQAREWEIKAEQALKE